MGTPASHPQPKSSARRLAAFRELRLSPPIPRTERLLVVVLGVQIVLLPWPLATTHPVPQLVSFALSLIAFGVAIKAYGVALFRHPLFWTGGTLMAYVLVQASNPNWQYFTDGHRWWLAAKDNVAWLPTSVRAPFESMNAFRQVVVYGDAWLLACSAWLGITRRKSIRILLGLVVANGLLLTGLLAIQRCAMGDRFPWPLTEWTPYDLAASFVSRNQAGAYLALGVFSAASLAIWSLDEAEKRLRKSSPAGVLALAGIIIAGGVLFTLSRGAVLTLALGATAMTVWFFIRRRQQAASGIANPKATAAIAAIFVLCLFGAAHYLDFSQLANRFDQLASPTRDPSISWRVQARQATTMMLDDHWVRGIGAGGFRYLFTAYARHYPEIYQGGSLYWEHAHCDWLEIPVELGLAGDLLIGFGAALALSFFIRKKFWSSAVAVPILLGCGQTLLHAWIDFPFQCPAILCTWLFMLIAAAKWLALSEAKNIYRKAR